MSYSLRSFWTLVIGVLLFIPQGLSNPLEEREPKCTDIVIPVTISAMNAQISLLLVELLPVATLFETLLGSLFSFTVPVQGTYSISVRYCEPEEYVAARYETLQVLVHGINYNKNYWSGDGAPGASWGGTDDYSWVSYASKQGYSTLAIDRLGSGNSSHPDPVLVVQTPAQVEVLHQIILKAKAGSIPSTRAFNKIILAGHSYGSFISNALNQKYPNDVDVTILTGFSNTFKTAIGGILPLAEPLPADLYIPADANLNPEYLEIGSQAGALELFYYSPGSGMGYDPALAAYDYGIRGTFSVGELISLLFADDPASSYTRPIYVVTGQHDFIFCNALGLPNAADCSNSGPGYLNQTQALYPAASVYGWYAPPNSGHCWHLHYDALETFYNIHYWLWEQGF